MHHLLAEIVESPIGDGVPSAKIRTFAPTRPFIGVQRSPGIIWIGSCLVCPCLSPSKRSVFGLLSVSVFRRDPQHGTNMTYGPRERPNLILRIDLDPNTVSAVKRRSLPSVITSVLCISDSAGGFCTDLLSVSSNSKYREYLRAD